MFHREKVQSFQMSMHITKRSGVKRVFKIASDLPIAIKLNEHKHISKNCSLLKCPQ
jgi:hypothetical protein